MRSIQTRLGLSLCTLNFYEVRGATASLSEGLNSIPVLKIEGGGSIEQSPCILILNLVWVYRKLVSMSLIDEVASRKD